MTDLNKEREALVAQIEIFKKKLWSFGLYLT